VLFLLFRISTGFNADPNPSGSRVLMTKNVKELQLKKIIIPIFLSKDYNLLIPRTL
jgi:hypothetical protein